MKTYSILTTLINFICVLRIAQTYTNEKSYAESEKLKIQAFSEALVSAIQTNSFIGFSESDRLEFLIHKDCENFALAIIENVMRRCSNVKTTLIEIFDGIDEIPLRSQKIIFIYSDYIFKSTYDKLVMRTVDFLEDFHIVIYQESKSRADLIDIIGFNRHSLIVHALVLNYNETTTNVDVNVFGGLRNDCKVNYGLMNFYSSQKRVWRIPFKQSKIFKDFKTCPISIYSTIMEKRNWFRLQIFNAIGSKLNFDLKFRTNRRIEKFTDYSIQNGDLRQSYGAHVFIYTSSEYALIHNTGELYDEFEKMIFPFDFPTWILIIVFFGFGYFVIIFINVKLSVSHQEFVFGRNVKSPVFNMVIAFFGQEQKLLPGRNFARYLLMMFVLFCLVIRTAYQSVQFDIMLTVS